LRKEKGRGDRERTRKKEWLQGKYVGRKSDVQKEKEMYGKKKRARARSPEKERVHAILGSMADRACVSQRECECAREREKEGGREGGRVTEQEDGREKDREGGREGGGVRGREDREEGEIERVDGAKMIQQL